MAPTAATAAGDEAPAAEGKRLVQDLHAAFGDHHARAVHAKGIILEGRFEPTAEARALSRAEVFARPTAVIVRFSNFTGLPDIADNVPHANPRGMAIKFGGLDAPMLDVVAHNFNGFPTSTAAEFGELLRALAVSGPSATAPTPLDRFLASHPVAKTFLTTQHPAPISYATTSYFGVNAITFTDVKGRETAVRYRFAPVAGEHYVSAGPHPELGADYLKQEAAQRLAAGPIRFDWYAQVGEAGDRVDDPSLAWPESRILVKLGTITIEALSPDAETNDRALAFIPGRMPDGIAAADPMLAVRTAAYPISFGERR
jgi:catalase